MNDRQLIVECPKCGEQISVQDALSREIKESISQEAKEKAKKEISGEIEYLQKQNEEKEKKLDEARKFELEIRKKSDQLIEEKRTWDLQKQRQIDAEKERIRDQTAKEILAQQHFKDEEKDKKINDLKKTIDDLQQKASQGSQQAQGEVVELDLEKELREIFPSDEIQEIKKGERGADIHHTVRTIKGNFCGIILWESKQTKTWKDEFIDKLKDDLRTAKANIPVIVTNTMPKESKDKIYYKDGVWICTYSFAVILAELIRQRLIEVAREKFLNKNQGTKAEELYLYINGHEFRQELEAIIESYISMKKELEREKRAFESIWKNREEQIEKVFKSTARIYGTISGKVGSEFPQLKGLDLLESGDKT